MIFFPRTLNNKQGKGNMKKDVMSQGDLTFVPMEAGNATWTRERYARDTKSYNPREDGIIQEGEATGHHHRIKRGKADLYRPPHQDAVIITHDEPVEIEHDVGNTDPAYIEHEKHGTIILEPNKVYTVRVDRELAPGSEEEFRRVVD